jgi:hypothetical protein
LVPDLQYFDSVAFPGLILCGGYYFYYFLSFMILGFLFARWVSNIPSAWATIAAATNVRKATEARGITYRMSVYQ